VEQCREILRLLPNADADVNAVEDTSMDIEGRRKIMSVSISIFSINLYFLAVLFSTL